VLAHVLFSPCCLCFGRLFCFGFAACRAVSGGAIGKLLRICKTFTTREPSTMILGSFDVEKELSALKELRLDCRKATGVQIT